MLFQTGVENQPSGPQIDHMIEAELLSLTPFGPCANFRVRAVRRSPRGSGRGSIQARSSGGERYLDTVEVGGSIPPAPTIPHDII